MHPIPYLSHIFRDIYSFNLNTKICYLDRLGLDEYDNPYFKTKYKSDYNLLDGHDFIFSKNYARKKITGFFSRINLDVIKLFLFEKFDNVMIIGYQTFSSWYILILSIIFKKKIFFKGEAILKKRTILNRLLLKIFFFKIDFCLYSCSGNFKFYKSLKIKECNLIYAPCSVDYNFFLNNRFSRKDIFEFKKNFPINNNKKTILFVSKLIVRKNPFELIKAVSKISNRFQILFVGDGPLRSQISDYAKISNVEIFFAGFLNQTKLALGYQAADLYVNTSLHDASPKTLNECLCFNIPIICPKNIGQADDVIVPNLNGFKYNLGDIDDLKNKIIKSLSLNLNEIKKCNKKIIENTSKKIFTKNLYEKLI